MNTTGEPPAVLGCWKEIAQYLGKGVRTVQRWEREFGLPVRRPDGSVAKSAVAASTRDIDVWLQARWSQRVRGVDTRHEPDSDLAKMRELLASNRTLRHSHDQLLQEFSMSLGKLMDSCNRIGEHPDSH